MSHYDTRQYLALVSGCLLAILTIQPISALAHEPTQTIADPGFRPESEHAALFVEAAGESNITVLPTIVRRIERTAHSFASQQQIVDYLNESGLAVASTNPRRMDLGPLRRISQWEIFQAGERAISELAKQYDTGHDYLLVMEILVPGNHAVFGIEVYIMDQHGNSAFSFLLNSHHEMFANARLEARNLSEEARDDMISEATRLGMEALERQLEQARMAIAEGNTQPESLL